MPLYQVLICGIYILSQLQKFWTDIQAKLADKHLYKASIGGMRLRLSKLQESDPEARKFKAEGLDGYEEVKVILHHQGLPFVPEAIQIKLISQHHDDPLAGHFGINKTRELIGRKYY